MNYTPSLFVLFPSFQKKDPHALSAVHVKHYCYDFDVDVAAALGDFFRFCEKPGVGAAAENFRFFLFRTPDAMTLFPQVKNYSWNHLRDHSFAEAPLLYRNILFPALKPSMGSFVHDHALFHLKIGDRTVDY